MLDVANLFTAVALAALTAVYVYFTARLVRVQTYPNVVVFVEHSNDRPTIIQIVIKNVGFATAKEVSFTLSRPPPKRAFGLDVSSAEPAGVMDNGPLITGIPALGPGSERRIDWGQFGGLKKALGDEKIDVACTFAHYGKRLPPTHSVLEVESFAGTNATPSEASRIADSLEKIRRNVEFGRLKVEIMSLPPRPRGDGAAATAIAPPSE